MDKFILLGMEDSLVKTGFDFETRQVMEVEDGMLFGSNCRSATARMARLLKLAGMLARTVPRHNLRAPCRLPAYSTILLPVYIRPFQTLLHTRQNHTKPLEQNGNYFSTQQMVNCCLY